MSILNIFSQDAFSVMRLTDALPSVPIRVRQLSG
jgi:hypothetical protein